MDAHPQVRHHLVDGTSPIPRRIAGVVDAPGLVPEDVLLGPEGGGAAGGAARGERALAAGGESRADGARRTEVLGGEDLAVHGPNLSGRAARGAGLRGADERHAGDRGRSKEKRLPPHPSTARTERLGLDALAQTSNGKGTILRECRPGGETRRPAAITGRQEECEKFWASTIRRVAKAVSPGWSLTVCRAPEASRVQKPPTLPPCRLAALTRG